MNVGFQPFCIWLQGSLGQRIRGILSWPKCGPRKSSLTWCGKKFRAHLVEGKKAPKAIAAAIMNLADDLKSGRDPVLRSGDYITLMRYARSKKIV